MWVESESVRIGRITLHPKFFKHLKTAQKYIVHLPLEERVKHTISDYPNWIENKEDLKTIIPKLVKIAGHKRVNEWLTLIDQGHWEDFVRRMFLEHYDPMYMLSQKKNNTSNVESEHLHIDDLGDDTLFTLVNKLGAL